MGYKPWAYTTLSGILDGLIINGGAYIREGGL